MVGSSIDIDHLGDAQAKNQRANRAALTFAEAVGGVPEDVATGEVYSREAWSALRIDALGAEIMLYEQFTLLWSPEGDRVVTQGLRKLGLHELAMTGVSVELAGDVITTLSLIATLEHEGKTLDRNVSLSVAEVQNLADRSYLEAWMVWPGAEQGGQAGTGQAQVTLLPAFATDCGDWLISNNSPFAAAGDADASGFIRRVHIRSFLRPRTSVATAHKRP